MTSIARFRALDERPLVARFLAFAALALYGALLLGQAIPWHDILTLGVALTLIVRFGVPRRGRYFVLATIAVVVLWLHLAYVWSAGYGGRNHVFAGTFGLSDAGEYYWDASRVLHGAPMASGGARRPIFSAVLAGCLRILGNDLRAVHVLFSLFWAGAGALAADAVWRTHGRRAGGLVFVLFVLFARRYVGFVQSEGIGGPLGALAFALIWRSQAQDAQWKTLYLSGLLALTTALLARPGPFLVVAGLVLWALARTPKGERLRLAVASLLVVVLAYDLQVFVRQATTTSASYGDLPPILYGLFHAEDSFFVFRENPWLNTLDPSAQTAAMWRLLGRDLAAQPWQIIVAPLRCLGAWLALPQGFFGFVWLNADDRVLESKALVSESIRAHGYVGPLLLWVRTLGVYSLVNALVMAVAAVAFVVRLVRASWRALRRRGGERRMFAPLLVGFVASVALLPPWVTEGAQISATILCFVLAFVATDFRPPLAQPSAPAEDAPLVLVAAPPIAVTLAFALVALVKHAPVRPPDAPCGGDGSYAADVDWRAAATYGKGTSARDAENLSTNLELLRKNNGDFAASIAATRDAPHVVVPAYDACGEHLLYVVGSPATLGEARRREGRWIRLRSTPMAQRPLELAD